MATHKVESMPVPAPPAAPAQTLPVLAVQNFCGGLRKLGQGAMGAAYWSRYHGTDVALKEVLKDKDNEQFLKEIMNQAFVKHENIVQVMGIAYARIRSDGKETTVVSDPERQIMVSEYCTEGSLGGYLKDIRDNKRSFDEECLVGFMRDVARGMAWLHGLHMIHKDLKPENILLHDSMRRAKIGDFGLAKVLRKSNVSEEVSSGTTYTIFGKGGTLYYIAPECFWTGKSTRAADVYAFGIVLHNCFITLNENKTYDAKRILANRDHNNYTNYFIAEFVREHLRPEVPAPEETKMSPEVAAVILPMIQACLVDEGEAVSTATAGAGNGDAARPIQRPTFVELLGKLDDLLNVIKMRSLRAESSSLSALSSVETAATIARGGGGGVGAFSAIRSLSSLSSSDTEKKATTPPLPLPVAAPVLRNVSGISMRSSSQSLPFQLVHVMKNLCAKVECNETLSLAEQIEFIAVNIGRTEDFLKLRTAKERVSWLWQELEGEGEATYDTQFIIKKFDLVSAAKLFKSQLNIDDKASIGETVQQAASILGIADDCNKLTGPRKKAERIAEELGLYDTAAEDITEHESLL